MTPPEDEPRRPPPATGRQDRHRAAPPAAEPASPDVPAEPGLPLPPRGAAHYAQGRSHQLGLGCLVVLFIAGTAAALLLVVFGLAPDDDFVPAAGDSPGSAITENPPGGSPGAPE